MLLISRKFPADLSLMKDGLERGFYSTNTIKVDGEDRFLVIAHVNDQNIFYINAVVQLTKEVSGFAEMVKGLILLAKSKSCVSLEAISNRCGVVKQAMDLGFRPLGIALHYEY